ncbi:helix-turn-helix domain-containing protein [Pimelobacter simplex]|uniref:helix-turn-helix domain-containing protein n=1 Tax=Nocardioides simplex TaxID=2045 RepID=UPI001934049A|nr:helix-turn-helix transcriptional regulator [Pimelobacter simplex]
MTGLGTWFDATPESVRLLAEESALLEATELVAECLTHREVSRSELAKRLGVGRSEVTQRLSGKRNLSVKSLGAMLHELGYRVRFEAEDVSGIKAVPQHVRVVPTGAGSWRPKGVKYTETGSSLRVIKGDLSAA